MIAQSTNVPNIKTDGSAVQTLYSKMFNKRHWETDALAICTTSKYFKDLQKGDQVEITNDSTVTWKAYENGMDLNPPNRQKLSKISVVIDQAACFNEALTDVDELLSHLALRDNYLENAVKDGQAYVNSAFFTAMKDAAASENKGASAGKLSTSFDMGTSSSSGKAMTTSEIVRYMTSIYTILSEQKVRDQEIWCFVPPWMVWQLMNSELKNAMNMADRNSVLRSGDVGVLAGKIHIYESTYLPGTGASSSTPSLVLAGTREAIAYSSRLSKVEAVRVGNFETLLQGLMVWGWKCVKPELLINGWVYKDTEK